MKMINNLRNGIYRNKTDKLVYFEKIFKLLNDCDSLNMFEDVNDVHKFNDEELESGKLYGFKEKGAVINGIFMEESYYLFFGNICIIYNHGGHNQITRIKVKEPSSKWRLDISNYCESDDWNHVHILNKCIDVYAWWDVDWMGLGKRDCQTVTKSGSWWKYVYDDICGIYEAVAKKSVDYLFDEEYKNVKPAEDRMTIEVPVKVTLK